MVYYQISKSDLHGILRMLGALQEGEEVINISNIPVMNAQRDTVGILAGSRQHANWAELSPEEMTADELQELQSELVALEMLLQREYNMVRSKVAEVWKIMRRRKVDENITADGLPADIDSHISETLRTLLTDNTG